QLERANLFVECLDSKRQWYRYHALFAQALRSRLERTSRELVPILHYRASLWYAQQSQSTTTLPCECQTLCCAQQDQTTAAVLHALSAHQWQWAADLIESLPVTALTWGASEQALVLLRHWLEQLPADIVHARPRLCLACAQLLWGVAPYTQLQVWLDAAEATLTTSLTRHPGADASPPIPVSQAQQEQENLLGEVFAFRALLKSHEEDGPAALALCQQALALLSAQDYIGHAQVAFAQLVNSYTTSTNGVETTIKNALRAGWLAQAAGNSALAIGIMGTTALYMLGTGRLRKAYRLTKRAIQLGTQPGMLVLPEVGWPALLQAEILREWNQLDAARSLVGEALSLCQQTESILSLRYVLLGHAVRLRVCLSHGELDTARSALQEFERIGMHTSHPSYLHQHSLFTTIDQVRLWIACGERERAARWAQELNGEEEHDTPFPFTREREEVAGVRILLAKAQSALALERLEPLLRRATMAHRWGHVIEMQLLQALAHQMNHEEPRALSTLSEAVRLAEPEGYIRSFADEGAPMEALLSKLREQQCKAGPTPYLDTVLAAFPQQSQVQEQQLKEAEKRTKTQPLLDPLSVRELEVLQLMAQGASNQQIAQELVIAIDTVKRHVSHIFSKLGVNNRVQAIKQAQSLGILDEEL
ncbi:MAG TPA: LuxR C-terminal-related transcriptional regulator, partial [Ktedonobacteraceae bacterium]|nr:LuxR C-terminal-related transcriptional regulator [Ktedonobacteraceae bacterium]